MEKKETLKLFALFVVGILIIQEVIDLSFSIVVGAIDSRLLDFDEAVVDGKLREHGSQWLALVVLGVVVPLLETLVFQYGLMRGLGRITSKPVWIILITSLCFGLSHYYSLVYVLNTTLVGVLHTSSYYYLRERHSECLAFATVFVAHGLHNALVVLLNYH